MITITVTFDIDAEDATKAYRILADSLKAAPEAIDEWESDDRCWYREDGDLVSEEEISRARIAYWFRTTGEVE